MKLHNQWITSLCRRGAWKWVPTDVRFVIWLAEVHCVRAVLHIHCAIACHVKTYSLLQHRAYSIIWIWSTQMTISFQVFFMELVWDWLKFALVSNSLACSKASRTVGENSLKDSQIPSQATSKDNPGKKKLRKLTFCAEEAVLKYVLVLHAWEEWHQHRSV